MPLMPPLSPPVPHDKVSRAAVQLNDTELSPEQQKASMEAGFGNIRAYLEENELALKNVLQHRRNRGEGRRIISEIGYRELGHVGLPSSSATPVFQYIAPKAGQVLARKNDEVPTIFVIHSFGGGLDLSRLKSNRAQKSIAVDRDTGFNPARYYNGIRELVAPGSAKSIHHVISRRGDLTNSAPWDITAFHGGGPLNESLRPDPGSINHVSIGVELEEYYIRHGDETKFNPIINRVPYTEQQYAVIAFLLRKYVAWTENTDILKWLGPDTITQVRSGESGLVTHRAFNPQHADPSAEFMFPPGFVKGDAIPAYLHQDEAGNNTKQLYEKRIELFWGDVPNGTPLSAWDSIFKKYNAIRTFKLDSEVFDLSLTSERILLELPEIKNSHIAALSNKAGRDTLSTIQRAQQLQGQARKGFWDQAVSVGNTVKAHFEGQGTRNVEANRKQVAEPTIENALVFDFVTGKWTRQTTVNKG